MQISCTNQSLRLHSFQSHNHKKDNIYLRIFKPHDPDKNNYLIYELIENSRMSGTISEINELLELCQEIFGEDCIIRNYGYYK